MNVLDLFVFGLTIIVLTLVALKFIAPPCSRALEPFQDSSPNTMKCPRGTKSFTNSDGNIQCCRGEVTGNRCEGKVACKISASADSIPFCKTGFQKKWDGEVPEFIKAIVKNMSKMENFSYDRLYNDLYNSYQYLGSAGYKYNIPAILYEKDCDIESEFNIVHNFGIKELKWLQNFIKEINKGNYESKAEIDEALEDFFAYIYFSFPPLYMPYITKLETCMQLKKMQKK